MEDALGDFPVLNRILMHMNVDKAGGKDFAGNIDFHIGIGKVSTHPCDFVVLYQNIEQAVPVVGRIHHPTAVEKCFHSTLLVE